jgi:hypothetical protein
MKVIAVERIHYMNLFIPENLDIDAIIKAHPPQIKHFKKEKLAYLLHLINYVPASSDKVGPNLYTPLCSELLQDKMGNYYQYYLDYLYNLGIIERDEKYWTGGKGIGKCYGYRFAFRYQSKLKPYKIKDKVTVENISADYKTEKEVQEKYNFIIKNFKLLQINEALALQ